MSDVKEAASPKAEVPTETENLATQVQPSTEPQKEQAVGSLAPSAPKTVEEVRSIYHNF